MKYNKRIAILTVIVIALLVIVGLNMYRIYINPSLKVQTERVVENFSVDRNGATYTGELLEQDILFNGRVTYEVVDEYIENLSVDDDVIVIKVYFYDKYEKDFTKQDENNLKFESMIYN